ERLIDTWLAFAPRGYRAFLRAVPSWMGVKLHLSREISRSLGSVPQHRLTFVQHHESHAASAFFPSPFTRAALLTLDGVGEWATATIGVGDGNRLEILFEQRFPHSLGLLYAAFTHLAGFRINSGEYKLMGLAPYGQPRFVPTIMDNLIDLRADGSFRLDLSYFDFAHGSTMTSKKFHRLFEGPARQPEAPITQREKDLAASIQAVTQEIVLRCARHLHQHTGEKNVCLAGGVALNCVANGWLRSHGPFERVWVQPASGDAGGALGAALFVWHQLLSQPRIVHGGDTMQGALLGPCFSDDELEAFLQSKGLRFQRYPDDRSLCERVADLLEQQAVIGWFQGRMEYGPRALGNRSIVADPRSQQHRDTLNLKIKFRESFRPFAPSVLAERAHEWFDVPIGYEDPYMLFVVNVRGDVTPLPAVTHIDGTARVQTVDGRHGRYRLLLEAFAERTGCPVLVNTSFNVRGEPIVCTPADAYGCFLRTNLDVLVLGRCVVVRDEQVDVPRHTVAPTGQFPLD
ncbi:MAG TPA: carbamoyltransferase N-terminal domain-containing protein, partial [Polyangiaceae bacterium]|nr:carbamoyltransferase N-terminal domain-containing protein [Polyangiaceae bacterium]